MTERYAKHRMYCSIFGEGCDWCKPKNTCQDPNTQNIEELKPMEPWEVCNKEYEGRGAEIWQKPHRAPAPFKSWIDYGIKTARRDALGQAALRMGVIS